MSHHVSLVEFYAVLVIIACYVVSIFLGGSGLFQIGSGRKKLGTAMLAIALLLDVGATLFGATGHLPW